MGYETIVATSNSMFVACLLLKLFRFAKLRFRSSYSRFRTQPLQFGNSVTGCSTSCRESDCKPIIEDAEKTKITEVRIISSSLIISAFTVRMETFGWIRCRDVLLVSCNTENDFPIALHQQELVFYCIIHIQISKVSPLRSY